MQGSIIDYSHHELDLQDLLFLCKGDFVHFGQHLLIAPSM